MGWETVRFLSVIALAVVIATFPFWYPEVTGTESKLVHEESPTFVIKGVLKEVGDYYVVVETQRGEVKVSVHGWYRERTMKWFEVLNELRSYVGYGVIMEVEDEGGGNLVAKHIEIPSTGVRY